MDIVPHCVRGLSKSIDPPLHNAKQHKYVEVTRMFLRTKDSYRPMSCLLLASGIALLVSVMSYAKSIYLPSGHFSKPHYEIGELPLTDMGLVSSYSSQLGTSLKFLSNSL